jgi:hypothetical protein
MSLHPCPSCRRHARASEASCPFCGEALVSPSADRRTRYIRRVGVIAAMASLSGCPSSGSDGSTGAVPPYGLPPEPDMVVDVDGGPDEPDAGDDDAGAN